MNLADITFGIPKEKKLRIPTPFFPRDREQTKQLSSFLSKLILCLLGLPFLFACAESSPKSRMEKRISIYLDRMESSAIELEHELEKITDLKRLNTAERMRKAIFVIKNSEKVLKRSNQDVSAYIAFINSNSRKLKQENLDHYIVVTNLLNRSLRSKRQSLEEYFLEMTKWLDYSATHFKRLEVKDQAARGTYDCLLTNVNRSLKKYNTANTQHHQFINSVLASNPEMLKRFKKRYKTMKNELGWL